MRKRLVISGVVMFVTLALTGCSDDADQERPETNNTPIDTSPSESSTSTTGDTGGSIASQDPQGETAEGGGDYG